MGILDIFRRKAEPVPETRSSGTGYTAQIIAARESYITGMSDLAELSSAAQTCVSLWECGLAAADVEGTDMIARRDLAIAGRSLALRGEAVFLIREDRLIPAADWDLSTRDGIPRAYRISISEAGGGRTETVLAGEVLHFRVGTDPVAPWAGQAPLRRAALTAGLLQSVEEVLSEVYREAPFGSQIVPYPETREDDLASLGRGFRGKRGRVLLRESVHVSAAGGPAPAMDWRPQDVTPDMSRAMTRETLDAARASILTVYGILPALMSNTAQGPLVREAQRHLAGWVLQPVAEQIAEEASDKLGSTITIDTMRPLQAFDAGGKARALSGYVEAMARAKEAGLSPGEVAEGLRFVNLE